MPTLCERQTDISIIIPVYNLEPFLQPMLTSLKNQRTGDYKTEIIFVLNNCTDDSEGIIRQSGLDCAVMNCEKQGCGPARNMGFASATGEYVWFMDGDDWLLSDTAVKDCLDKAYTEDLNILWVRFVSDQYRHGYFSMVWQYLMKREFIAGFRFPDYQPAEDDVYMTQVLAKAGHDIYNYIYLPRMDEPQYYYNYMREGSNMYRYNRGERI